jgi:release factor glutamine methyltransferase
MLIQAAARLAACSSSARLDAEVLLAHVLGRDRSFVLAHAQAPVDAHCAQRYAELLARRARGEPLAYLVGEREFWSLPLKVSREVLVPRPETELAVERCLALLDAGVHAVADLGTGSGAIALALATERPAWRLTATDVSSAALALAHHNGERLELRNVEFAQGSWFMPLVGRRFALIVANPPYIAAGDPALQHPALQHEPAAALRAGDSGYEALSAIIAAAPEHLEQSGWLVLEHGAGQAARVAELLNERAYVEVRCYADLAGRERVTQAQWCGG